MNNLNELLIGEVNFGLIRDLCDIRYALSQADNADSVIDYDTAENTIFDLIEMLAESGSKALVKCRKEVMNCDKIAP